MKWLIIVQEGTVCKVDDGIGSLIRRLAHRCDFAWVSPVDNLSSTAVMSTSSAAYPKEDCLNYGSMVRLISTIEYFLYHGVIFLGAELWPAVI